MAFETHPEAYWNAGLSKLPDFDVMKIGFSLDGKDYFKYRTLKQAADIFFRQISENLTDGHNETNHPYIHPQE